MPRSSNFFNHNHKSRDQKLRRNHKHAKVAPIRIEVRKMRKPTLV